MKRKIYKIGLLIFLFAGGICIWKAYKEYQPYAEAEMKYQVLQEYAVKQETDGLDRKIDFDSLKQINPDIIGWLYAPQIGVDLPILKGETDQEYLYRSYDGEESIAGALFTFADTGERLLDPHICIFGHKLQSGEMFGELDRFQDNGFLEENNRIYLYTPERSKELIVEETLVCAKDDAIFQNDWENGSEQIVTLVTCTSASSSSAERFCVNCRVDREKVIL